MARLCEGRVVVVTGSGRGLGRAHALELARQGARLVVNDLGAELDGTGSSTGPAGEVVDEIREYGGEAIANGDDISEPAGAEAVIRAAIETFGGLHAVVNNAGILRDRMLVNMTVDEWDAVLKVHLRGTFCMSQQASAYWREQSKNGAPVDARIINTTSPTGLYGHVGQTNYGAAKAGIAMFTIIAAEELGRYGVTVNAICPAARTRMTDTIRRPRAETPSDGFDAFDPANVSPLVTWLASADAADVTGRVFNVRGGNISIAEPWMAGAGVDKGARWDPAELGPIVRDLVAQARPKVGMSGRPETPGAGRCTLMVYQPAIDVDSLFAIDIHVHAGVSAKAPPTVPTPGSQAHGVQAIQQRIGAGRQTPDETAAYYRERKIACAIWGSDPQSTGGARPGSVDNDELIEAACKHNDIMIPFVMVDPWRGRAGALEAERLIAAGARGFKFHPPVQGFSPNERRFYDLYEVLAAAKVPALFHTGQTAVGQGAPRGGGVRLKYGNPMFLDDLAVDFPDMPIIMAHPSFPWQDEALSVAVHKPQVYIDLSGWSPKYFPPQLVQYANTLIKHKVLFGSDHPMITTDRWLSDFETAGFRDEVKPLLLKENAARLLGLRS